jgi:U3 small nucleolar RNA-associated protein 5
MLIKRFSGHHFTDIFSMSFVTPIHFISAAVNDRYICLWNSETGSATSLVCEKDLMAVHSTCEDNEQEMIKIVSVCQDGLLHLYTLESHNHKVASDPILPSTTIQFVQDGKSQQETPLPVLAAHLTIKNDILIAHSSIIRPVFENISFEQPEGRVCLTRACPKGLILPPGQDDDDKGQTTSTQISSASTLVGHTNPRSFPWKQDNEDNNSKDLSMMDRLNSLSLDHQTRNEKHNTESLSLLVIQGVHSGDKQMLEQIFNIKHDRLINATVRKLPITVVVPFLKIVSFIWLYIIC